jgi:nucleotide-binding universal stress UspA family protein
MLAQRWHDADAFAVHQPPVQAILGEARRFGAHIIVLGWRGHGALRRLLADSVSREVVSRAHTSVLVARNALRGVRRLVVGFDGSPGARRAVRFASRLAHRPGRAIVLASVIVPPGRQNAAIAQHKAGAAAALLRAAGWPAKVDVRSGAALEGLLDAASERGSVLIVGASARRKGKTPLGTVAAGALNHFRGPVVIVR